MLTHVLKELPGEGYDLGLSSAGRVTTILLSRSGFNRPGLKGTCHSAHATWHTTEIAGSFVLLFVCCCIFQDLGVAVFFARFFSQEIAGNRFLHLARNMRPNKHFPQRTAWGGGNRRGWKTSRMTPLPKRGFGPPSYGTFSTPLRCQCSVFSCAKVHDRADQKLFWRGPKTFGRVRSLVRFPPPLRCAPPHITTSSSGSSRMHVVYTHILLPLRSSTLKIMEAQDSPQKAQSHKKKGALRVVNLRSEDAAIT